MTGPYPHGHPRADVSSSGRQSNGVRSDNYSPPDPLDDAEELVAAPGHGGVGVFQAPQPLRARPAASSAPSASSTASGMDDDLDIDSPFLDLFGGAAPPR